MPNKYAQKKGWHVPKQKHKVSNWSDYSQSLKKRGRIEIWMTEEAIDNWYVSERVYDGTGTPMKFTDFAITICHEIRQVYKLALRQTQGFIDSIFAIKGLSIKCPDYSCLCKRLSALNIKSPRYKKSEKPNERIVSIAIDSTGLKCFGRDEWHQEKHKIQGNRSWRKLHIAVDDEHIIHSTVLTDKDTSDDSAIDDLLEQVDINAEHFTADGSYDKNPVYHKLSSKFNDVDIVIPTSCVAVYNKEAHPQRNRNLQEIKTFGRMNWQRARDYGKRNNSELSIQRRKRILGNTLHAREFSRQQNEAMLGSGILNKMTRIGMPNSFKIC